MLFSLADWAIDKGLDLRVALTRLNKISGDSGSKTTNIGIGLIKHF